MALINEELIEVSDTSTVLIGGVPLRRLELNFMCQDLVNFTSEVTERIGGWMEMSLMPPCTAGWDGYWELGCYNDVEISYIGDSWCDEFLSVPASLNPSISLFPNPGTDHFTIQAPGHYGILEVMDVTGRRLLVRELRDGSALIDASLWDPGLYLLRMEGSLDPLRWMKE